MLSAENRRRQSVKIPRSNSDRLSDSDSEMSYKDRGSPILFESGLKSFLGHPGHNYPLINGKRIEALFQKFFFRIGWWIPPPPPPLHPPSLTLSLSRDVSVESAPTPAETCRRGRAPGVSISRSLGAILPGEND